MYGKQKTKQNIAPVILNHSGDNQENVSKNFYGESPVENQQIINTQQETHVLIDDIYNMLNVASDEHKKFLVFFLENCSNLDKDKKKKLEINKKYLPYINIIHNCCLTNNIIFEFDEDELIISSLNLYSIVLPKNIYPFGKNKSIYKLKNKEYNFKLYVSDSDDCNMDEEINLQQESGYDVSFEIFEIVNQIKSVLNVDILTMLINENIKDFDKRSFLIFKKKIEEESIKNGYDKYEISVTFDELKNEFEKFNNSISDIFKISKNCNETFNTVLTNMSKVNDKKNSKHVDIFYISGVVEDNIITLTLPETVKDDLYYLIKNM